VNTKNINIITFTVVMTLTILIFPAAINAQPRLSGTISINGEAQAGQVLTVNVSNLGGSGIITFQWLRNGSIVIGSGSTYRLTTEDIDQTITVTVIRSDNTGSITSAPFTFPSLFTVWSFTDELDSMIHRYYTRAFPNSKINYTLIPSDQFESKLNPMLLSGRGAPDVFALESAFVRNYVESGQLLDLTDIVNRHRNKLASYTIDVGTYNGRVYALSWQLCPGGMFYRRSLARKYLGTDDPVVVQTYFSDFNKFIETAALLKEKSRGVARVITGYGELYLAFLGARTQPWVVNNRLTIDPIMEQYMEISKTIRDNRYDARISQWSEGWFAGMRGDLRDENGNRTETFAYFLPTWGLHYVLKTSASNTSGDWAMIKGPAAYRWGGTWIGANKNTKNPEQAKQLIEWLTTNDQFLTAWATDTGDVVSNLDVVNQIKGRFSEAFLGGQNHYAAFAEIAKSVNGRLTQRTDNIIEGLFQEEAAAFINGEKTKEKALSDFRVLVRTQLGIN